MSHQVRDLPEREAAILFGGEPKPFQQLFSERAFEEFIRKRIQAETPAARGGSTG